MNINNTRNVISNSNTWGSIYNKLIREFLRITPHADEYLNIEQLTEYMEISDPDRLQPSSNVMSHTIYSVLRDHHQPPLLIQ